MSEDGQARRWRRRQWALLAITLGVVAGLALASALGQTPSTLVAATLHTESLRFTVSSTESARIAFPAAWQPPEKQGGKLTPGTCLTRLLLEPERGAIVSYTRPAGQSLIVTVAGPVRLIHGERGRESGETRRSLSLEVRGDGDGGCARQSRQRLPVEGHHAVFGAHPLQLTSADEAPMRLLGGRLTVYGRAISRVLNIPLPGTSGRNALYVAGEVPLPGGAVIEEPETAAASGTARRMSAMWSGFADVDFGAEAPAAISVEAATNAGSVTVYLPTPNLGQQARSNDPETVSLSLLARLSGDPHLLLVYGFLGLLALLLGLVTVGRDLLFSDRKDLP